jgi:hypothetical protein
LNIIVRHYLNKRLKPLIVNGIEKFPVYVRVTYARKNHKINSIWLNHKLSDFEFVNDTKVQTSKSYEAELIKDIISNGLKLDDLSISSRILFTQEYVSKCFFDWTLEIKEIKERLIKYISEKTNLSIEIFERYVRLTDLYPENWIELASKEIFNSSVKNRIIYFATLLKFESLYYPDNSDEWTPGLICNYFEWEKLNVRSRFLDFIKKENLLSEDVINEMTKKFDNHLIEWRSCDFRG